MSRWLPFCLLSKRFINHLKLVFGLLAAALEEAHSDPVVKWSWRRALSAVEIIGACFLITSCRNEM